ncbi:MAG: TRAP transporter fused permease subunit [Chloroflexi bacterium]|nr:TRAP transporter fused permease subunit [Chloroflexota bacterium]
MVDESKSQEGNNAEGPAPGQPVLPVAALEGGAPGQRDLTGVLNYVVTGLCLAGVAYVVYVGLTYRFYALEHRSIFWAWMVALLFLMYPLRKGKGGKGLSPLDIALAVAGAGMSLWICLEATDIMMRIGRWETYHVVIATAMIVLTLEACRRSAGKVIVILALVFMGFALAGPYLGPLRHAGIPFERHVTYQVLGTSGMFGIPLGVIATFVFLFILYGAILERTGAGRFFADLAYVFTGGTAGGPAKLAVVSSLFFGSISGSSIANTTSTGAITIPLMKNAGYPAEFAAGAEAGASTEGQLMPPVMGAAAFIMAEFLGIPYVHICIAAFIPALFTFVAIFMQVHFYSVRRGIRGLPMEISRLRALWQALWWGGHHLISVGVLVGLLVAHYSPMRAAIFAILTQLIVSSLRSHSRLSPIGIAEVLRDGALRAAGVAAICAAAGFVIGAIVQTGLGVTFSATIVRISGDSLIILLSLSVVTSLILGMGVPTTAKYIIVAALVAPAMMTLGVLPLAAHLFVFYFASEADITPPVALAAYAAAGIARANPMKAGVIAWTLGLGGYILPFIFIYNPGLLLRGPPLDIGLGLLDAFVAVVCISSAIQGYLFIRTTRLERILLGATAAMAVFPLGPTTLLMIPIIGGVVASQLLRRRRLSKGDSTTFNHLGTG